jgi:hypothetical protein
MRWLAFLFAGIATSAQAPAAQDWVLSNFAQRLEAEVANPRAQPVLSLVTIPVSEAAKIAPGFPGTLAIAVEPGEPPALRPSQADDLDGDGIADEFVFPVYVLPGKKSAIHMYYSTTLRDSIPWPKQVHASHAFGYNHATAALESEVIGYRTYGGFFLDIQARASGYPGLHNSLVGYVGSKPSTFGRDIFHIGDTLGLGGLFLRRGGQIYRPPLNMPDYAHKPETPGAPHYRVISSGPIRAMIEARIEHWKIGDDEVDIRALYSIAAGSGSVECKFEIAPRRLSGTYEVGAGIRRLPEMKLDHAPGRLALSGQQNREIGPLGLALYYDPAAADAAEPVATKDDSNECVIFRRRLGPAASVAGHYWLAGVWSGSGIRDLTGYLEEEEKRARVRLQVGGYRYVKTPLPERVEGEAP